MNDDQASATTLATLSTLKLTQVGRDIYIDLNRPGSLNAINDDFFKDMLEATTRLRDRLDFDLLAIRSTGTSWCAGLDMRAAVEGWTLDLENMERWERSLHNLETLTQTVVALINGHCIGGGLQLALACDIRIASSSTRISIPAARELGYLAGMAPWRLTRLVGIARSKALLVGGALLTGRQAAEWGVVDQVVAEDQDLEPALRQLRSAMTEHNLVSTGECKRIIRTALETGYDAALTDYLSTQARLLGSEGNTAAQKQSVEEFRSGLKPGIRLGWRPFDDARADP